MEEKLRGVSMNHRAFKSVIVSAIEVYNRETNGCLTGRKTTTMLYGRKKRVISVRGVYPFQMEKRTPSEVIHGNIAAFRRAMGSMKGLGLEIIGGYHSHPYPYGSIGLSEGDVTSIRDEIKSLTKMGVKVDKEKWLEVLVCLRKKSYAKPQELGWSVFDSGNKVRVLLKTDKYVGYHVVISAYWILFNYKKPRVREVNVSVPLLI